MTTLSWPLTVLLGHGDMRCAAPSAAAAKPRAGCCVLPAPVATRKSVGFRGRSARAYAVFPGAVQGQRESIVVAHFSGRNSVSQLSQRRWRCFADLEKTEPESAAEPTNPSCCADSAEQGDSATATEVKEVAATSGSSGQVFETYGPGKQGNQLIALASVTVAVGLFISGRFGGGGPGLPELAATAISYQEALSNGRPTVVEFYADWCEVCKETAHDVYQIEQEYRDQINFVMLNVDNSKWEEELDEFGVEGIPHFAFLDREGNEEGNIVGRLPRKILKENLAALARGDATVPHSRVVGQFSNADSKQAPPVVGPRSHSQMS